MVSTKKIGVVLSGGGARGAAHVGVLKALNEHDIYPTHIAGASAGALIGSLYAHGISPEKMLTYIEDEAFKKIFKISLFHLELPDLKHLKSFLKKHIKVELIEELKMPLFISATNINKGTHEILSTGSLIDSVAASCAIPLFFKPVALNDKRYVDGGVLNNLPVEPLLSVCDQVIGVNVCTHDYNTEVSGRAEIAERIFQMSIWGNMAHRIEQCDFMIEVKEAFEYSLFDLKSAEELYHIGYESAIKQLNSQSKILSKFHS